MLSKEYLNDPRMSQSKLKSILDGVEEFKYNLDNPPESSDAQNLGTAVHLLLLQPDQSNVIVKKPTLDYTTRKGKIFKMLMQGHQINFFPVTSKTKKQEKGVFYEVDSEEMSFIHEMTSKYGSVFSRPEDFILLSESDFEKAHRMTEAAIKNTSTNEIFQSCTEFEKAYFFDYRDIPFKCQLDGHGNDFIVDVKTTSIKNSDREIRNEIINRRYHFQAALYSKSFPAFCEDPFYYLLFIRNVPPYAVFPVQLSTALLAEGQALLDEACSVYNYALENNPEFVADNRLRTI